MSPGTSVTYLPGRSCSLHFLQFEPPSGAQAAAGGLYALEKARVVLQAIVEPIVL